MSDKHSDKLLVHRLGNRTQEIRVKSEEPIGSGMEGVVSRMRILRDEPGRDTSVYVHKKFKNPSVEKIEHATAVHDRLTALPNGKKYTLRELGYTDEGLFMTDLSEGGRVLVFAPGDSESEIYDKLNEAEKLNPHFLDAFLGSDIMSEWKDSFEKWCQLIAEETSADGIELASDSIFLGIYQNGDCRPYVADMGNVSLDGKKKKEELYEKNLELLSGEYSFLLRIWAEKNLERKRRQAA